MPAWADTIDLIAVTAPEQRINSDGIPNAATETPHTVFCDETAVGYNEFYKSQIAGYEGVTKVTVHKADYASEKLAEYKGQRYTIIKTYPVSEDLIELTMSDIKQESSA